MIILFLTSQLSGSFRTDMEMKKWTLSGIARREFLNHSHWLLAICVNTIWLPPNWNIHTSEQMAPFALLPFLVPYTLSSCLWVCRHLMCAVMCERRCISWPWQCMQTFFTIHAKHRLPTPSERGEQEFHTVLFKLAAFSLKGSTVWHSYWPFISK